MRRAHHLLTAHITYTHSPLRYRLKAGCRSLHTYVNIYKKSGSEKDMIANSHMLRKDSQKHIIWDDLPHIWTCPLFQLQLLHYRT